MNLALQGSVSPVPGGGYTSLPYQRSFRGAPARRLLMGPSDLVSRNSRRPLSTRLDVSVVAPHPSRMTRESEFGYVMSYGEYAGPVGAPLSFTLNYDIERLPIAGTLDPSRARSL